MELPQLVRPEQAQTSRPASERQTREALQTKIREDLNGAASCISELPRVQGIDISKRTHVVVLLLIHR